MPISILYMDQRRWKSFELASLEFLSQQIASRGGLSQTTNGEWCYVPSTVHKEVFRVIYQGRWDKVCPQGEDFATSPMHFYTYAELFRINDEDDELAYAYSLNNKNFEHLEEFELAETEDDDG